MLLLLVVVRVRDFDGPVKASLEKAEIDDREPSDEGKGEEKERKSSRRNRRRMKKEKKGRNPEYSP